MRLLLHVHAHNMSPTSRLKLNEGFSLIETVIFMTILTVLFVAISFATSISLRRAQFNQKKIMATRYAEEVEEWLRGEKEADWSVFVSRSIDSPGNTYCFDNNTLSWPTVGDCSNVYGLDNIYKREAILSGTGTQVTVTIRVEWLDGQNIYNIPIDTVFSRWE